MSLKLDYGLLKFVEVDNPGKKTRRFRCQNKAGDRLGWVYFYPPWRRYVFAPPSLNDAVYDAICLGFIRDFLNEATLEHASQVIQARLNRKKGVPNG